MSIIIAEHELYDACRVLFGMELEVSRGFLEYIQLSGIKTAYRKRAFETHPDMMAEKGHGAGRRSGDLFLAVQQAYEQLTNYLEARENGFTFASPPVPPRPVRPRNPPPRRPAPPGASATHAHTAYRRAPGQGGQQSGAWGGQPQGKAASGSAAGPGQGGQAASGKGGWSAGAIYRGHLPTRRLLFGHFLYYSGVINWQTIIKALVWQRMQRPRLGEIGCRFGWLKEKDVLTILRHRQLSHSFGQSAMSMGLLSGVQLKTIIFQQQRLQKKFGEYLTHHNILTVSELERLVRQFQAHNAAHDL